MAKLGAFIALAYAINAAAGPTGFPPCDALIAASLDGRVLLATSDAYEPRVQSWWSANGRYRPWCFFQPQNTQEVSIGLKSLANSGSGAGDWHIAIRSGGHSYPGSNNIANGVTIDLGMMNSSSYDPTRNLASVEPGAAWKDVYDNLLHNGNVTVTGGRDGGVGVGGFLLGGGNSYYSGTNGFGCDTVVNYQVVLSNGTIVQANSDENSSLWKALKGGGSNFGIVTRFDMKAMPAVDLAYGRSIISSNYSENVIDAMVRFTDLQEKQRDDHLITLYAYDSAIAANDVVAILIGVNTHGDLNSTSFDETNNIPALTSSWERKSLAAAANDSQVAGGTKNIGTTLTFLNSPSTLHHAVELFNTLVTTLKTKLGGETFGAQLFFQPLPSYYSTLGPNNVLGLDHIRSNAILYTSGVYIKNGDDAALTIAQAEVAAMTKKLKEFTVQEETDVDFVYLNYADASQDPLGSYGSENMRFMKDGAEEYDPNGFWQERVPGGFKISRVVG